MTPYRSVQCDRARAYVSLELDGELSDLERAMLAAHVARCAECRAYEVDVVAFTEEVRSAPLEPVPAPLSLPSRRRAPLRSLQLGVAASLAVAVVGVSSLLSALPANRAATPHLAPPAPRAMLSRQELEREIELILRTEPAKPLAQRGGPLTGAML